MFCRSISLIICIFVAVTIAMGYSGQNSSTGSDSEVAVHHSRSDNLESSTSEAAQYIRLNRTVDLGAESSNFHSNNTRQSGITGRLSPEEKNQRLIEAAKQGAVGELEALLAAGADVGAANEWGWTGLHWAADRGHEEVARRLLAAGAAVGDRDGTWQLTPLHWAAMGNHAAVVRLLLAAGADHGARLEVDGWTPLHWAAFEGHTEAAAALLEGGADAGARDNEGDTPVDLARSRNKQQVVELLQAASSPTPSTQLM